MENPLYSFFRENMLDNMGRMRSNSLFLETQNVTTKEDYTPLFTLKQNDIEKKGVKYISLKKIYFSYNHIPGFEYEFAMDIFSSWEHWVYLSTKSALRHEMKKWQEELDIKLRNVAISLLMETAKGGTPSATVAAKYLADRGWETKAGRPSNAEKEKALKTSIRTNESLKDDMERLGITLVGNK